MLSDPIGGTAPAVVLAIFAHPDDESLLAGGTLAACAASGLKVVLWSLTRGEQGPIAQPERVTRGVLGALREAELRRAGRALGASVVECLGYPDGELASMDPVGATADLTDRLRALRPSAVVTFGPEGFYWHPDHVAVHELAMAALDATESDGLAPWVYWATWPAGRMTELIASAGGKHTSVWGLDPAAFGAAPGSITTVVDVRHFLPAKLRALRAHDSQLPPDHLFAVLPDEVAERFLSVEYFTRAKPAALAPGSVDWLTAVVSATEPIRGGPIDPGPPSRERT